mgnify:CR=1 FL=1|jgi:hypothetical protein
MRLIDGDTLWKKLDDETWYDNADRDEIALPFVADAPTVDAVVVTRCKDCKYYNPDEYECGCDFAGGLPYIKPDDFCSYGEPKEV